MRTKIAAAIMLAGFAGSSGAADWTVDPRISLLGETEDNHRLSAVPGDEISVSGLEMDARLTMRARTPRSTLQVVPRIVATKYPDESDDDTTNGFLHLNWDYRGEKSLTALDLDYAHRTVLGRYYPDSPVPDDGEFGDPRPGTGSGRTTFPTDQDDLRIGPQATYNLTERTAMLLRLGYQDVRFDDQVQNDRVNYTSRNAGVGMQFRTSPTAQLRVVLGAGRYEPETNFDSDSQSLNVEWSNNISEVSRIYTRGGASRVKADNATDPGWHSGFNGGAGIQWAFEVTNLFLDLNHYVDPSAAGRLVNRDQLRFELSRRFSVRTQLNLAVRAVRDDDTGNDTTFRSREYYSGLAEYEWRFTRQFSLRTGYEYTWRKYEDEPNDAASNRFYLGIMYEPHRH